MRRISELLLWVGLSMVLVIGITHCDDDEEYETCDLADPDCADGTVCRPMGEGVARCVPSCDASEDCNEGYVCRSFGDGSTSCVEPCNPDNPDSCDGGYTCELYADGEYTCAEPFTIAGMVFDMSDSAPIEGAHVVAANEAGFAVSGVATTDADGNYTLTASSERDADGVPTGIFTLRVSAQEYLPYPFGIRPSIPIDSTDAVYGDGAYIVDTVPTDVGLIPLPAEQQGLGSITGSVTAEGARGTLVVAEGGEVPAPFGFADQDGVYTIFNVPSGSYEVRGYQAHLQLQPASVDLAASEHRTGVDLGASDAPLSTVDGQVNIVNAPGGSATSVVLVTESTFDDVMIRGEVPPGLREPEPGIEPNVGGAFVIEGVPDGDYVVLAAFENDLLIRDPDPTIGGTQIVHISVPGQGTTVSLPESFKITEALAVHSPGADAPEPVSGTPTFIWEDDSSESGYHLRVFDAFGGLVWEDPDVPSHSGSPHQVEVTYGGPALEAGMYYQFRATSYQDDGPISTTEDLRGVFFLPAE